LSKAKLLGPLAIVTSIIWRYTFGAILHIILRIFRAISSPFTRNSPKHQQQPPLPPLDATPAVIEDIKTELIVADVETKKILPVEIAAARSVVSKKIKEIEQLQRQVTKGKSKESFAAEVASPPAPAASVTAAVTADVLVSSLPIIVNSASVASSSGSLVSSSSKEEIAQTFPPFTSQSGPYDTNAVFEVGDIDIAATAAAAANSASPLDTVSVVASATSSAAAVAAVAAAVETDVAPVAEVAVVTEAITTVTNEVDESSFQVISTAADVNAISSSSSKSTRSLVLSGAVAYLAIEAAVWAAAAAAVFSSYHADTNEWLNLLFAADRAKFSVLLATAAESSSSPVAVRLALAAVLAPVVSNLWTRQAQHKINTADASAASSSE